MSSKQVRQTELVALLVAMQRAGLSLPVWGVEFLKDAKAGSIALIVLPVHRDTPAPSACTNVVRPLPWPVDKSVDNFTQRYTNVAHRG